MIELLFKLAGGIGLLLLGMVLLSDGFRAFAGEALRRALVRFTGTPLKAFASGALATAMVQSSSATTITVIGFVSAGLLTFPQAVGVVMGASLGTTGTSWLVAVLGLSVSLGFYALPLIGVGALLRLLGRTRWKSFGLALAGFGLLFVGIEFLQEAMSGLSGVFDLAALPGSGFVGHALAALVGFVMTLVMHSSGAAVATTLTALHSGAVNFDQAASLVIGAAIGTTVTSALAAVGANVPAQRTALAHVVFNLASGLIALVLLPLFLRGVALAQAHLGLQPGPASLAAFHTAFIGLGALLFLPFANDFARWIERRLPDRDPVLTRHLDPSVLSVPAVALEATRRALTDTAHELFSALRAAIEQPAQSVTDVRHSLIQRALEHIQEFSARIPPETEGAPLSAQRIAQMHAIDHLLRLLSRLPPRTAVRRMLTDPRLQSGTDKARTLLATAEACIAEDFRSEQLAALEKQASALAELRRTQRPMVMRQTAGGEWTPAGAIRVLDAMRWLERVAYHTWRLSWYLAQSRHDSEQVGRSGPATEPPGLDRVAPDPPAPRRRSRPPA